MRAYIGLAALLLLGAAPAPVYVPGARVALGAPDRWGYLKADPTLPRLYAAHGDRITVIDTAAMKVAGEIAVGPSAHGVAVLPKTGHGYAAGGRANKVTVFDLATLATVKLIETSEDPDEMVAEPEKGWVWVIADHGQHVERIDSATDTVTASIAIGDTLESATTDHAGHLFVDSASKHEVVAIDTAAATIMARWPVPDCASLHGIDYDAPSARLFVSCTDGHLYALDAKDGQVMQTLPIGRGADVVSVAPRLRRVMVSNADGILSVFTIAATGVLKPGADVVTPAGARTMALEHGGDGTLTGRVFLTVAERTDDQPTISKVGGPHYTYKPGTVAVLELIPRD